MLKQFSYHTGQFASLNHYLFRYPAKFHPPVARSLVKTYSHQGDVILDPFCGSGTLLIEAAALGRSSIGVDIDPLAIAVSQAKTGCYDAGRLEIIAHQLTSLITSEIRPDEELIRLMFEDITDDDVNEVVGENDLFIPEIPNIEHWFQNYVLIDLAKISSMIEKSINDQPYRNFFSVIFGSTVRRVSNADPVPASGLEVTKHMRQLEQKGRKLDVFATFLSSMQKAIKQTIEFALERQSGVSIDVLVGDSRAISTHVSNQVDVMITSPPYLGAIDYYRRHTLEMYWLNLVKSRADRLALLPNYVGRPTVPMSDPLFASGEDATKFDEWIAQFGEASPERLRSLRHYMLSMSKFFGELTRVPSSSSALAVLVVGQSRFANGNISSKQLFEKVAAPHFRMIDSSIYQIKNRYMSYARHNGNGITEELVLVFEQ